MYTYKGLFKYYVITSEEKSARLSVHTYDQATEISGRIGKALGLPKIPFSLKIDHVHNT